MSLDDLFGGAKKKRRGNKNEREESVRSTGEVDPFEQVPERHRGLVEPKREHPFEKAQQLGRLGRPKSAEGSSLDDLGKAVVDPRGKKGSTADRDFNAAGTWGRFKGK
jgi:hypothetical protein